MTGSLPRRFSRRTLLPGPIILAGAALGSKTVRAEDAGLEIPDTPAGRQLRWVLETANAGGGGFTPEEIEKRYSPDYLAVAAPGGIAAYLMQNVVPLAPLAVARFEGGAGDLHANTVLATGQGYWRGTLSVDFDGHGKINTMWFEPATLPTPLTNGPETLNGVGVHLSRLAPLAGYMAAELKDGEIEVLAEHNADQRLGLASTFKIYVLGTIAEQVRAGEASWTETLTTDTALHSLPNGYMGLLPGGLDFPLVHFAEEMIARSDNTATDHLIHRLGRETVEQGFRDLGHGEPERNTPLLMTREWFAIKLRFDEEQLQAWFAADEAGKREQLESVVDPIADTLTDDEEWLVPTLIEEIEWFASARDLTSALAWLHSAGQEPGLGSVMDCLSLQPDLVLDPATWRYVGYKAGYETGVDSNVYLLQRADGRWFTLAAVINDPEQEIPGYRMTDLVVTGISLLAQVP